MPGVLLPLAVAFTCADRGDGRVQLGDGARGGGHLAFRSLIGDRWLGQVGDRHSC